jgi:hypothetical protein
VKEVKKAAKQDPRHESVKKETHVGLSQRRYAIREGSKIKIPSEDLRENFFMFLGLL